MKKYYIYTLLFLSAVSYAQSTAEYIENVKEAKYKIQRLDALDNLSAHLLEEEHPDFKYWNLETIQLAKEMGANELIVAGIKRFNDSNTCLEELKERVHIIMPEIDRLLKYKKSFKDNPLLAEIYCCKAKALDNLNKTSKEIIPFYLKALALFSKYDLSSDQKLEAMQYLNKHSTGSKSTLLAN